MATKKQAAEALGVSLAEVLRMIKRGDLKAKKKTASVFSDWDIDLKSVKKAGTVEASVKATLAKVVTAPPEASEPEDEETDVETTQPHEKVEEQGVVEEKVELTPKQQADRTPDEGTPQYANPALERRRLFLLKRRQQRESQEKKGGQKDGKRIDSGRESKPERDGGSSKGGNQATPKESSPAKEPKWWF
jgi:hypothetical protein